MFQTPQIELPEPMETAVQVHVDMHDEHDSVHVWFKVLSPEQSFHEVPLPGDWIIVRGRRVTSNLSSVSPTGEVSQVFMHEGVTDMARLEVRRRMWQPAGVVLVCALEPEDHGQDPIDIVETLDRIGFRLSDD